MYNTFWYCLPFFSNKLGHFRFKTKYKKNGNKIETYSEDALIFTDVSYTGISLSENINETYVVDVFRKLQKLNRFGKYNLSHTNLIKSLREYENSMSENSLLYIFKCLYNSLELATNSQKEETGDNFDKEVSNKTSITEKQAYEWRQFYNRIKHMDKSHLESNKYIHGLENVLSMISPLRRCGRNMITHYLQLV